MALSNPISLVMTSYHLVTYGNLVISLAIMAFTSGKILYSYYKAVIPRLKESYLVLDSFQTTVGNVRKFCVRLGYKNLLCS
jgi:hypothetical protein